MPEIKESLQSGKIAQDFNEREPKNEKILQAILVDATGKEQKAQATISSRSPDAIPPAGITGHVYPLASSTRIVRGQCGAQTPVYPPNYSTSRAAPPVPIASHKLTLTGVFPHPRNVILKFNDRTGAEYWLQVQLFTHTVLQIYSNDDWNESIAKVPSKPRGFKVGVAFQFAKYIMAFVTLDNMIQLHWANSRDKLPAQGANVLSEFPRFLDELAKWLQSRCDEKVNRSGNAMEVMRSEGIFCGVGVYTVAEIWHRAGLSPSLTEAEVFDSGSRTARLCAAYYTIIRSYTRHLEMR
ncbi:hypothetical protein FPV67DRAFT_1525416 [Lyophyllum atratum]|nr:hypothetical protein FPV67DRAFT_1525416 [Lyophyllum atratum]